MKPNKSRANWFFPMLLLALSILPIFGVSAQTTSHNANPQSDKKKIFVFKIDSEINAQTNRYSKLALEEADELNADIVILDLDTYGGALNDGDEIRTRFLEFDKPLYVFINKNAASAGALISIACDSIYMTPGASIGAATVVVATGEAAPDKYQSYMRSIMRSTAEARGRNPKIAEAMVDEKIAIDSVTKAGEVITFSTSEAIKYHFCEAEVNSIPDILKRLHIDNYEIINFKLTLSERIIRLFINPFVSGILILIILGGIYFEMQTPGIGFPLAASILAAILYFTPYYLNGLAQNWEILLFFTGLILLALEIFVIPGFGVAGILGIICSLGGLILVMLNNDYFDFSFVKSSSILVAVTTAVTGLLAAIVVMAIGGARLANSRFFHRVSLHHTEERSQGYTSDFKTQSYLGKEGTAYTVLRPSGKVLIDGDIFDAYTRGEYIAKDQEVVVIEESGTSLRVRAKG